MQAVLTNSCRTWLLDSPTAGGAYVPRAFLGMYAPQLGVQSPRVHGADSASEAGGFCPPLRLFSWEGVSSDPDRPRPGLQSRAFRDYGAWSFRTVGSLLPVGCTPGGEFSPRKNSPLWDRPLRSAGPNTASSSPPGCFCPSTECPVTTPSGLQIDRVLLPADGHTWI